MGWLKFFAFIAVVYLGQSYYMMMPAQIEAHLAELNALAISDADEACDRFSDDVEASVYFEDRNGHWEVEGGKTQLCAYLQEGEAAMRALRANVSGNLENIQITTDFPWQKATAEFDEVNSISAANIPSMKSKSHVKVELKKGLTGLKINKFTSKGTMTQ